ncbi:hypothetical protein AUC43_14225 [Hymenobacter sedentarius]|uniref:TonB C-terminal domain-containing protein n=1 Tax=Hymenobacter sedentarius TaxID=1411621 RepID=A0A0U3T012_9BACT|nr:energy transducer TonB [Hymenobacter sedentarius]ALW86147.1 hypothetical protein AUC43_14225 [Hymenobacter sedentarius]
MRKERARMMQRMQVQRVPLNLKREVLVELLLGEDGRVASAKVVRSSAHFLNNAALRSVEKLKRQFMPARLDGEVVVCRYLVPVSYTMAMPYQPTRIRRLRTLRTTDAKMLEERGLGREPRHLIRRAHRYPLPLGANST